MELLQKMFNDNIFYQFMSAIFSIVLTVTGIYIKRENDRNNKRNYYEGLNEKEGILGDINIKIDDELPSENYKKLTTMWGLQPLLLLVLLSFIDNHNAYVKICIFFLLLIFTLLHEFLTGLKYSANYKYQIIMFLMWLITFATLSYEKNDSNTINAKTKVETKTTAHNCHLARLWI
jgi:hypothetical protein